MENSEAPSARFGERLKRYRLVAGLSAQKLSDRMGGSISRGVIANIESGTKKDVTVDELVALAYALDIPPVMLALPVEEPNKFVGLYKTSNGTGQLVDRAWRLTRWFNGENVFMNRARPARALSTSILQALQKAHRAHIELSLAARRLDELGDEARSAYDEAWAQEVAAVEDLRALGIEVHGSLIS